MSKTEIMAMIEGKKPEPPDRIYGWRDTQMSIARHYGGLTYQGVSYVIDYADIDQPLVRAEVLRGMALEKRKEQKLRRGDAGKQGGLI